MLQEAVKQTQKLIAHGSTVILGLSGGPDSVFLLHVLNELKKQGILNVIAAHLDHQWREHSGLDTHFCKKMCAELQIPFISEKAVDLALNVKPNGSQEEVGRKLRRFFFEKIAHENSAHCIALAHHRQDQQETFLMRLVRGASLSGLCSIKEIDGRYVRPLLHVNKEDIVTYLEKNNIEYLHDPTNTSDMFLRNRIRMNVIPALRACDDRFDGKFDSTIFQLQQEDAFLQTLAQKTFDDIFSQDKNNIFLGNLPKLKALDVVMQRRVILYWLIKEHVSFSVSTKFIEEIIRFINSPRGGSHMLGTHLILHKKEKACWIDTSL